MAINTNDKEVLYVDVDDDITTIIDKVRSSGSRVVALVLPKRATVFQSIVNMKLLKRSAESAKKNIVLVTAEPSLMPLAGNVGIYVAATTQSKPIIPVDALAHEIPEETIDESTALTPEAEAGLNPNSNSQTVGDLSAKSGVLMPTPLAGIETLTLPDEAEEVNADPQTADEAVKTPKNKAVKIPSFNKFIKRLAIVIILILLIVGFFLAIFLLPKATIAITTNTSNVNVSLTATLDPSAKSANLSSLTIPAQVVQQQETTSQQVATTGQQNNGNVATGSVTMVAEECSLIIPSDVPAGTGVSSGGLTYITQQDTSFTLNGAYSKGGCDYYPASAATPITAQSAGSQYNTSSSSASFTVAGRSDVSATGSASGGTDNIVQIVTQTDINNAEQKLSSQNTSSIKIGLEQQLTQEGYYPLDFTFTNTTPSFTPSNNVGAQATSVTVTESTTYSMYGAKRSNLDALISSNISSQISLGNQKILNYGLSRATMSVVSATAGSEQISLQTTAVIGPSINTASIKKQVEGQKSGQATALLNQIPGVTNVNVHLSPFWVSSIPTNPSKIAVTVSKAK